MDNELKDAVTVEMLQHNRFIVKCLTIALALSIFLNALIIGGIGYIIYNYDFAVNTYGDISNSENVGNKQNANEMNIYNGDK